MKIALITACALPGCNIYSGAIDGQDGVLSFYEPREYPADSGSSVLGFDHPIALGARADVWVLGPGLGTVEAAESDAPGVVSVAFNSYPIELSARSEGTATLHVMASNGSDRLPLRVLAPDGARVWILSTPPLLDRPDGYYGNGYALRPGAELRVAAELLAGTTTLLGFDLIQWSVDPELIAHEADSQVVNTRRIEALGKTGIARIATQFGGELEIATLSAEDTPTLKLYSFASDPNNPPEITALAPGDIDGFLVAGNDAAGRYVQPSAQDELDFTATITSGSVELIEAQHSGRFISLRACTGVGTLQISYLGAERTVPIEVTPEVADESCPQN